MPELPEVETVMRGLQPVMEGARFSRVELRRENLRFPFPARFVPRLEGRGLTALSRRAKYILGHLDDESTLIMHLGMSGRFSIAEGAGAELADQSHNQMALAVAHEHVVFHMGASKNGDGARIGYVDPRRFGLMDLAGPGELEEHRLLGKLGIEPLAGELDGTFLQGSFVGRRTPLKAALLDQRIIAGLGNIYVCEALYRAGLSPQRLAMSLADRRKAVAAQVLATSIIDILEDAISSGGSSLRDYVQTDGSLGYFQHKFAVYGRENQPCSRKKCRGTIARLVQSGRSTFYCPQCQN